MMIAVKETKRTSKREQSDQINNYVVERMRKFSYIVDTAEVSRMSDGNKYVLKIMDKNDNRTGLLSMLSTTMDYFEKMGKKILQPLKIFEDADCVYFLYEFYEEVDADLSIAKDVQDASKKCGFVVSFKDVEFGRINKQIVCVVDPDNLTRTKTSNSTLQEARTTFQTTLLATQQQRDKHQQRLQTTSLQQRPHNRNSNGHQMAVDGVELRYLPKLEDIPSIRTKTSQCGVTIDAGRMTVEFFADNEAFYIYKSESEVYVEIHKHEPPSGRRRPQTQSASAKNRTKTSIERYRLPELPLEHLARYRYCLRILATIRRRMVRVAVNEGRTSARLYVDGSFARYHFGAEPAKNRDESRDRKSPDAMGDSTREIFEQCERLRDDVRERVR
ncbi:hypothetical protein V1511DRAFT_505035 [Dipodascopsis uninucleata]